MKYHNEESLRKSVSSDSLMDIYKQKSLDDVYLRNLASPLVLLNANEIPPRDSMRIYERNNFPFWVFEYVVKGEGVVEIEDNCFSVSAGDLYILPRNRNHKIYCSAESPWIKRYFRIVGTLPDLLMKSYQLENIHYFPNCGDERIVHIFHEMMDLYQWKSYDMNDRAALLLLSLIQFLFQRSKGEIPLSSRAMKIRHYLDRMLYQSLSLERMSRELAIPRNQIIRICRDELHQTPYDYYLSRKISISKTMLAAKGALISETAAKLNFVDAYHFSRTFKMRTGFSPSEYQKRVLAAEMQKPGGNGGRQ